MSGGTADGMAATLSGDAGTAALLARLQQVKPGSKPDTWTALCPAHQDQARSLSVCLDGGKILLRCHAGCTADAIVTAVGLHLSDLFTDGARTRPAGLSLAAYSEAKRLPLAFLGQIGMTEHVLSGTKCCRVPYYDEGRNEVAVRFRLALTGEMRFRWRTGSKAHLYGLHRLGEARRRGFVVLVEGESDAQTCWLHHFPAVGLPGAGAWKEAWAEKLQGIARVYVVREPDRGGEAVVEWLSRSSLRERAYLLDLDGAKDPSALYLRDPDAFPSAFRAALDSAIPFSAYTAEQAQKTAQEAWAQCASLAKLPDIPAEFADWVEAAGVAGERRIVTLLYLALHTRFFERVVPVSIKGVSGGGKNHVLEHVLAFFPNEAYFALSSMSERALIYSEEPLQHRFLVVYEWAGVQNPFTAYLLRSLVSEGRIRYEFVEKTSEGMRPRLIERPGPTGVILSTTAASMDAELETRMLSVTIDDSRAQTAAVLGQIASGEPTDADYGVWRAFHTWLGGANHAVTVPFAPALASCIDPVSVSLRRHFRILLLLIRSHALIHQATRETDEQGEVVATLEDYAAVKSLVDDLISEGANVFVPSTIRETVAAVQRLTDRHPDRARKDGLPTGFSVGEIATEMGMDKRTAGYRVRTTTSRGYLRNLEKSNGRPARIILHDPIPEVATLLPSVPALRQAIGDLGSESQITPPACEPQEDHRLTDSTIPPGIRSPPPALMPTGERGGLYPPDRLSR